MKVNFKCTMQFVPENGEKVDLLYFDADIDIGNASMDDRSTATFVAMTLYKIEMEFIEKYIKFNWEQVEE